MWYLSQLGRREHYALPSYLQGQGQLGLLATDVWCRMAGAVPTGFLPSKLAQRYHPQLKGAPIVSQGLVKALWNRCNREEQTLRWVREGQDFGTFAATEFAKTSLGAGDIVLGYTAANLEQLKLAQARGAAGWHVQVDPAREWYQTRQAEQEAYPDVEEASRLPDERFFNRVQEEWAQATKVIVHSEHCKRALVGQGVDASRCTVASPAFEPIKGGLVRAHKKGQPLRVLFVGNHCLAKGFHYYVQAAKTVPAGMEFHSAGRVMLQDGYRTEAAQHVRMHGHLKQESVYGLMAASDVLVFPTLSDGFGLVQLEAMSLGLPVISTTTCGDVVRDGVDGLRIALRDAEAIVVALRQLAAKPDLYRQMSAAALSRAGEFSPAAQFRAILQSSPQ